MSSPNVYLSASNQENNMGVDGITEEARMNQLVTDLKPMLEKAGIRVYVNDPQWTLAKNVQDSNTKNPDLHIALHTNAGGGTGTETWCYGIKDTQSALFGQKLQSALVGALGLRDRGIKDSLTAGHRWAEVVNTRATAVLTEVFFHDSQGDINRYNERYQEVVQAFCKVVCEWFMVKLPEPVQPAKPQGVTIEAGGKVWPATIIEGRSYTQVRDLAEALGHAVIWDEINKRVIVK